MIDGFEQAGHQAIRWELAPQWACFDREPDKRPFYTNHHTQVMSALFKSNAVDLSVAMWGNGITSFDNAMTPAGPRSTFDALGKPHVMFWLDAPFWASEGAIPHAISSPGGAIFQSPNNHHLINNPGTAEEMRRVLGLRNVVPFTYGVNPRVFCPQEIPADQADLVYALGPGDPSPTPEMLEELGKPAPDMDRCRRSSADRLKPAIMAHASRWPSGMLQDAETLLEQLIRAQLDNRHEPMLERLDRLAGEHPACGRAIGHMLKDPVAYARVTMDVRSIENFERAFTFTYLSKHFRALTFGSGTLDGWDATHEHAGFVPYEHQARLYACGKLGLNVMRWQDDIGYNVKPYEITASGAALLTIRRAGLDGIFDDGDEVLSFADPAEARAQAEAILSDPARLARVQHAGRARTLRDHTWAAVSDRLLAQILGEEGVSARPTVKIPDAGVRVPA